MNSHPLQPARRAPPWLRLGALTGLMALAMPALAQGQTPQTQHDPAVHRGLAQRLRIHLFEKS